MASRFRSRPEPRIKLSLLLATVAGCAHLPECPKEGGPDWTEWQTPNFRMVTDLEPEAAEKTAQTFELIRQALVFAAWRDQDTPRRPLDIVVLASQRSMVAVVPSFVEGVFFRPSSWHDGLVLVPGAASLDDSETIKHELAHALAWRFGLFRNAPQWLMEGLAVYLSTTRFSDQGRKVVFGEPHTRSQQVLARGGPLEFEDLWRPPNAGNRAKFYATSWLLVHYLLNHRADAFRSFQARLPVSKDARVLWNEVFADWDPGAITKELWEYQIGGNFYYYKGALNRAPIAVGSRPVPHASIHGWRAELFALASIERKEREYNRALAAKEAQIALAEDPTELRANLVQRLFLQRNVEDIAGAHELAERHPQSPRAWLALAAALLAGHRADEAQAILEKASALGREQGAAEELGPPRPPQPYQ